MDAFELWCWKRLLRVPWTVRRSNQSILKDISPECSLKDWCWNWNFSILATSCEELTHWKRLWCWEVLGLEEKRVTKDEMAGWHHCLNGHEFAWTLEVGDGQGGLACCDSWGHKESDTTERLNWTEGIKGSSLHVSEIPSFLRSHNLPLYIYNITFCLSNSFVDGLCPLFRYCELCCMNIVYRYMFKTLFSIISGIHSQVKLSCEDLSTY